MIVYRYYKMQGHYKSIKFLSKEKLDEARK